MQSTVQSKSYPERKGQKGVQVPETTKVDSYVKKNSTRNGKRKKIKSGAVLRADTRLI